MTANRRLHILYYNYAIPQPDKDSGCRRLFSLLQVLAQNHDITLAVPRWNRRDPVIAGYCSDLNAAGVNVACMDTKWCLPLVMRPIDLIIVGFYWMYARVKWQLDLFFPNAPILIDSVDVHFARQRIAADQGLFDLAEAQRIETEELAVYRSADGTIAVSQEDADLLAARDIKPVYIIPNIVPTVPRGTHQRGHVALFIGSFAWHPNVSAVTWFVESVWPQIVDRQADAEFWIVGGNVPDAIAKYDQKHGVRVLGWVPVTKPYLDAAAVSVAPLLYGGGMKGKVNEAMAHGVPVVSTPIGLQGIPGTHGVHFCCEKTPEAFAGDVVELMQDRAKQEEMGLAGQRLCDQVCSPGYVQRLVHSMLTDATQAGVNHLSRATKMMRLMGRRLRRCSHRILRVGS